MEKIPALLSRKRLANLKTRMEQVTAAWSAENYESYLKFYVKILPRLMSAERCTIYITELGTENICSKFGTGLEEKQIRPPREGSIAGRTISSGKGIIVNDLKQRKGYHKLVEEETGYISRNMACTPIKGATIVGITGAIQVINKEGGFTEEDLALLGEVASCLSLSIESAILNEEILKISSQLNQEVDRIDTGYFHDRLFIAESKAMRAVMEMARLVSNTPVNVLIQGENGTGKELVARTIHQGSDRHSNAFIAVNCATIPEQLMESEFFGYEKGAFTGASRSRSGRFEEADGGTLLLDEIADMPLAIQPKFLRVLQEGEGTRLGGNKVIRYNFRLISATNKDLNAEVESGRFREDLFFRLFSVKITIPPLRERREDIIPMAAAFLEDTCDRFHKKLAGYSSEVLHLFMEYDWPGNVRQLHSEVERLVALTPENEKIQAATCSQEIVAGNRRNTAVRITGLAIPEQVKQLEIRLMEEALKKTRGNKLRAAALLGITRQGLHKKMKRYNLVF